MFYHSRDPAIAVEMVNLKFEASQKCDVQHAFVARILDGVQSATSVSADAMNAMAVSLAVERSLNSNAWEPVHYARSHT